MCGICGEVTFGESSRLDASRVAKMTRMLAHRGPDGEGLWSEAGMALGHRRLSIIDLSKSAAQPMASPDGRYQIVFNGEIYNHPELRKELESSGERFMTRSDTEVLLRALIVWGPPALRKLSGMWAFALWDRHERVLLLARDRLGVKPLYFAQIPQGIVFASQIAPLLMHPEVSREINPKALREQVACRYVLAPKTLLSDVQKLPPGHTLRFENGRAAVSPYWRVPLGEHVREMPFEVALEGFGRYFESAVEQRLISDVPLGVLLSGGVDSSAIVAAMRHAGHERVATFTVAFEHKDPRYDERIWARRVARKFESDHHEVLITPSTFAQSLPAVLSHLDDPVADLAALPTYHVCALAQNSVKVLLSGQGADELLGGYHLDRVLRQIRATVALRGVPGARKLGELFAKKNQKRSFLLRWDEIRNVVPGQLPGKMRYDLTAPLSKEAMARLLIEPGEPPYDRTLDAFYTEVPSHRGPLDAILGTLMKGWLPDNLLNYADRMSMAHGLEIRVPFLDANLIRFCFRLPERHKVKGGKTKRLLKAYAKRRGVPDSIATRRKRGFPVPWNDWVRGPLHAQVVETLEGSDWMRSYFRREGIQEIIASHMAGGDRGLLLWNLVVLARWGEALGIRR